MFIMFYLWEVGYHGICNHLKHGFGVSEKAVHPNIGIGHKRLKPVLEGVSGKRGPPKGIRYVCQIGQEIRLLQVWPEIPVISTYNPIYGMHNPTYNQL